MGSLSGTFENPSGDPGVQPGLRGTLKTLPSLRSYGFWGEGGALAPGCWEGQRSGKISSFEQLAALFRCYSLLDSMLAYFPGPLACVHLINQHGN